MATLVSLTTSISGYWTENVLQARLIPAEESRRPVTSFLRQELNRGVHRFVVGRRSAFSDLPVSIL
jgi:hypothetical protein